MTKEKKNIKRSSIEKLLKGYFPVGHSINQNVYKVHEEEEKSTKYMVITQLGIEIYTASKKVVNEEEVLDKVEMVKKINWDQISSVEVDKFALGTLYQFNSGYKLRVETSNDLTKELQNKEISVKILERKWYNKILGFRSRKKYKMVIACLGYLFIISAIMSGIFGEESTEKTTAPKEDETKVAQTSAKPVKEEILLSMEQIKTEVKKDLSFPEEYNAAKEKLKITTEENISIGNGNVGSVIKASDGFVVANINGEKITDVLTFKTMDEVKVYEKDALAKAEKAEKEEAAAKEVVAEDKVKEDSVPREYTSALTKAESYAETMYMSKAGIYDQLTSEYGENFPEEAAQYAIDNIEFDWKANALEKAKSYAETMDMSNSAIYDQLISEYGEKFTPDEAQYAIDNLE